MKLGKSSYILRAGAAIVFGLSTFSLAVAQDGKPSNNKETMLDKDAPKTKAP